MFFAHHQVDPEDGAAGRAQGSRQGVAVHGGIAVDPDQDVLDLRGGVDQSLYIVRVVHAGQLLHARRGRVVVGDQHLHPRGDHAILDGVQTLRTFGMVRAHLVLMTRWVRDKGEVHAKVLKALIARGTPMAPGQFLLSVGARSRPCRSP